VLNCSLGGGVAVHDNQHKQQTHRYLGVSEDAFDELVCAVKALTLMKPSLQGHELVHALFSLIIFLESKVLTLMKPLSLSCTCCKECSSKLVWDASIFLPN